MHETPADRASLSAAVRRTAANRHKRGELGRRAAVDVDGHDRVDAGGAEERAGPCETEALAGVRPVLARVGEVRNHRRDRARVTTPQRVGEQRELPDARLRR